MRKSYREQMLDIVESYHRGHGDEPVESMAIAVWAVETNRWEPPEELVLKRCQKDLSESMRSQHGDCRRRRR